MGRSYGRGTENLDDRGTDLGRCPADRPAGSGPGQSEIGKRVAVLKRQTASDVGLNDNRSDRFSDCFVDIRRYNREFRNRIDFEGDLLNGGLSSGRGRLDRIGVRGLGVDIGRSSGQKTGRGDSQPRGIAGSGGSESGPGYVGGSLISDGRSGNGIDSGRRCEIDRRFRGRLY